MNTHSVIEFIPGTNIHKELRLKVNSDTAADAIAIIESYDMKVIDYSEEYKIITVTNKRG